MIGGGDISWRVLSVGPVNRCYDNSRVLFFTRAWCQSFCMPEHFADKQTKPSVKKSLTPNL